jgi:hypothetical protein
MRKTIWTNKSVLYGRLKKSDSWELQRREDLSPEAEEQPLLVAVSRKLLLKTRKAGKELTCEVWKLAMVLYLFVVTTYKWSRNQISNPKPRRESL